MSRESPTRQLANSRDTYPLPTAQGHEALVPQQRISHLNHLPGDPLPGGICVARLINYVDQMIKDHYSTLQQCTLEKFRASPHIFYMANEAPNDINILRAWLFAWFQFFDGMLFFGRLQAHCDIVLNWQDQMNVYGDTTTYREDNGVNYKTNTPKSVIRIKILNYSDYDPKRAMPGGPSMADNRVLNRLKSMTPALRNVNYLGTLLHEMLHAFVNTQSCSCTRNWCQRSFQKVNGHTGHGEGWVKAYATIGEAIHHLGLTESVGNVFARDIGVGRQLEEKERRSMEARKVRQRQREIRQKQEEMKGKERAMIQQKQKHLLRQQQEQLMWQQQTKTNGQWSEEAIQQRQKELIRQGEEERVWQEEIMRLRRRGMISKELEAMIQDRPFLN